MPRKTKQPDAANPLDGKPAVTVEPADTGKPADAAGHTGKAAVAVRKPAKHHPSIHKRHIPYGE